METTDTNISSTPDNLVSLNAKATPPDLVKKIGGTTFDIHIHFSKTSKETFTDKIIRLIKNDVATSEKIV